MKKKVLVLGGSGMLGSALMRRLPALGYDVVGTVRGEGAANVLGHVDAYDFETVKSAIQEFRPDTVVNCVGVIRQRPEGQDPLVCISLNALFPHHLAAFCRESHIRLVHVSTDCVFSGHKGAPYIEDDFADANDIYGRTKYLGELHGAGCVTLRTSIIGHELRGKLSLIEWFLSQKGPIKGYTRAIYSGLPTTELARVIGEFVIPNTKLEGLYHVSSDPISKYELLKKVNHIYSRSTEIIAEDKVAENKSLNSDRFQKFTGWAPPDWDKMLTEMNEDYRQSVSV